VSFSLRFFVESDGVWDLASYFILVVFIVMPFGVD